jgi:aspartyl-tRNA synthetase
VEVELPMRRIPYDEAISRYGTDKPDLRFGLELRELTEVFRDSEFNAFRQAIEGGAVVRGLNAGRHELSRGELDNLVDEATELGAKGLVWAVVEGEGWRSPVAKFLSAEELAAANQTLEASEGDVLLIVADAPMLSAEVLGELRRRLGERLGLIDSRRTSSPGSSTGPCWAGPTTSSAGTRTTTRSPRRPGSSIPTIQARLGEGYDVVWNGWEIGGDRSVSATLMYSEKCSRRSESTRSRRRSASASCSRHCATGRHRTGDRVRRRSDHRAAARDGLDPRRDRVPETASGGDPLTGPLRRSTRSAARPRPLIRGGAERARR